MKKVVIIGGGVAGLTAGIYGQMAGLSCTVIEKNNGGAGALTGWDRDGCHIDGCLHWLTGTAEGTELRKIWDDVGMIENGEIVKTEAFVTSVTDGKKISFLPDAKETEERMTEEAPADRRELEKFFRAVKAASSLSGIEKNQPMSKGAAVAALAPYSMLDLGDLSERFASPLIKHSMTDLLGKSYSSLGFIFAYAAYSRNNGYLPKGGSRGAAERMKEKFKSLGGSYLSGKRAVKILTSHGKAAGVRLSDGNVITGDEVLCCLDPVYACTHLFEEPKIPRRFSSYLRRNEKYPLFSSVHAAFCIDSDAVDFKGTSVFPCSERGFGAENRDRIALKEYSHEPSFAPEGKTVVQSMVFTDKDECRRWIALKDDEKAYREEKERTASELLVRTKEALSIEDDKIRLIDSWTPATFSRYLGSVCGSYMSFAVTPATIPASFPEKAGGLENVRFVSQWSSAPGGVPSAAIAGKKAVDSIIHAE